MSTLVAIKRFIVPPEVVNDTDAQLRLAGRERVESFVLWSGSQDGDTFVVRAAHVPRQTAYKLAHGLCVRVNGDELHRLNVWLFEHRQQLGVQVHSHPTDAYHSETDDTYPIVAVRGGLSIVVPDFGRSGVRGGGVAWYRLGNAGWDELTPDEAEQLLQFTG